MPRPAIHRLLILIPVLAVLCFLVGFTHEKPTITAAPSEVGRVAPNAPSAIAPSHNTSHLTPATYVTYNYEAPGQPHRPHDAAPTYDYEPSHDFSGSLALSTADSPTDYIPSRPRSIRPQAQANAPNSQNYTYDASGIFNAAESVGAKYARGAHTIFRRDPVTGKVTHYETKIPQTNPRNPNPWQVEKRVDVVGDPHYNKVLKQDVPTPHVHEAVTPGSVRPALPGELPR